VVLAGSRGVGRVFLWGVGGLEPRRVASPATSLVGACLCRLGRTVLLLPMGTVGVMMAGPAPLGGFLCGAGSDTDPPSGCVALALQPWGASRRRRDEDPPLLATGRSWARDLVAVV
jgi:hypothetical protein